MFRNFLFTTLILLMGAQQIQAQGNGIIPLSGLKYFSEGIVVKDLDVTIDGARLLSNRVPLNKEIEIKLPNPAGFVADNHKTMAAGAEITILSPRGEVLLHNPNAFLTHYSNGFYSKDLNAFSLKFGIGAELTKGNFNGSIKIRIFDMKSKNQLRIEMPVTFAKIGERLQVSKTVKAIKTNEGANGMVNGLLVKNMLVKVDTSIRVAPKMAYTSMDISKLEGASISSIFQGKENFWVYDSDLNELKITDILLKQVKGAMENDTVDYTLKIPYRLKTANPAKSYIVRFRWESQDKSQVIDVVVNI